ncbi:MAG: branched-chain amino acid transport system substrate-binding protein, partial [Thalassolituus oleivorans]
MKTAVIGYQVSGTDPFTVGGYCAATLAVEEANDRGDLPVVVALEPIVDGKNADVARAAAAAFCAREDTVAVVGPGNSAMAVITQAIFREAGLLQLSSEASSPLLTADGHPNFFRTVANDEVQGRALGRVAASYLGAKRIAVLNEDSAWGGPIARIFSEEAARLGSPPVLQHEYSASSAYLDFDALVEATLACEPDLVYFAIYWNQSHIIAHRLRDRGLKAVFLGSDALKPYAFLEVPCLDTEAPYHSLAGIDMRIKPSAKPFLVAFADRFPEMLGAPQYAPEAYDCANLILESMRLSQSTDRTAILDAMHSIDVWPGSIGPVSFDKHGDLMNPDIGL